jgi:hypothetical protein
MPPTTKPTSGQPAMNENTPESKPAKRISWLKANEDMIFTFVFFFFVWICAATLSFFWTSDLKPIFYLQEPKCVFGFCLDIPKK